MDKRLKILLEEVKGSDPNLDTMDRNTKTDQLLNNTLI